MRILPILLAVCLFVSLQGWTCVEGTAGELEASLLLPNGSTFGEGFGRFLACVELNESPNDEVTVTIMSAQAPFLPALPSEDYVSVNETLTFASLTTNLTQCVNVEIIDDEVAEESVEFFHIVISSNNVPISGTGSQNIFIFDTDRKSFNKVFQKVELEKSEFTVTEGGDAVQVCAVVTPAGPATQLYKLSITLTDITTNGSDYTTNFTDFTIPVGASSACRSLTAAADGVVEDTETLLVSIGSDVEDASGNATVVIIDVDGANVTLESEGLSVQERNSGESSQAELCVQVEADRGPLGRDVRLLLNTVEGTADTSDFESLTDAAFTVPSTTALGSTVCYNVTITGDDVQEVSETFTINVRTVNSLDQIVGADTVNVTILNKLSQAYFQLLLRGDIDCKEWLKDNPVGKRDSIVSTITTEIEILCECGFTSEDIDTTVSGFKCSDDPGAVIFRGLIRSGKNQATEIVSYLQQWVSGGVSISITGLILEVDPMCTVLVQSLSDPECGVDSPTGSADATSEDGSSTAVIVGGVVAVVVFIIIVAVVVVAITVWVSWRKRDIYRRGQASTVAANNPAVEMAECPAYRFTYQQPQEVEDDYEPVVPVYASSENDNIYEPIPA